MAKYKVLVIGLSLKKNKVAKFGDLVEESQLSSDIESLVKGNYIELVKEDNDSVELANMSKAKLIEFCKLNGIEIEANLNKSQILDAIEENAKNIEVKE